jgi:HlyD family secretion protein
MLPSVSPLTGVVLSRELEVGDAVSSILQLGSNATLIMTLGDIRELYVKGRVDETDIGVVKLGQPVRITVDAFRNRSFEGKVIRIAPMGVEKDNVTRFEVRVSILDDIELLKVNMNANAEILLEEHRMYCSSQDNRQSIEQDLPAEVANNLQLHFVSSLAEVIELALDLKLEDSSQRIPSCSSEVREPQAARSG